MLRLGCTASLAALLCFGACTGAKESPPAPEPQVAAEAPAPIGARRSAPTLGFLEFLDPSHETVAYVGDVVPWLSRLSHSDVFRRIATDAWILGQYPTAASSSARMDVWLDNNKSFFPTAIAFGAGKDLGPTFARVLRMSLLLQACVAGTQSPVARPMLPELRTQLAADVEAFAVPSFVLWVQMADEPAATKVIEGARAVLGALPPTLTVTSSADSIGVSVKLDAFIERTELTTMLENVGAIASPPDEHGTKTVLALLALAGEAKLTRHGDALVLAIGPTPLAGPSSPRARESLGKLFTPEAPELAAWAGWDMRATVDINAETAAMVERWRETEAGRALLAGDSEDLAGTITDLQRTLVASPPRGEARVDIDDELRLTIIRDAKKASGDLASSGLVDLVPADAVAYHLDATASFGDALSEGVANGEDRLYRQWFKGVAKGDSEADAAESIIGEYHRAFATLRPIVLREGPALFVPPYATVVSATHENTIRFGFGAESVDIPLPAVAFFMVPARGKDPAPWFASINREAARGTFDLAGKSPPRDRDWTSARDLGLGVPTHAVALDWIDDVLPADTTLAAGPGLVLHHFEHRGFTVLSTSVALSKAILGEGATRATPPLDALAYSHASGDGIANVVIGFADALRSKAPDLDGPLRMSAIVARAVSGIAMTKRAHGESQQEAVYRVTLTK